MGSIDCMLCHSTIHTDPGHVNVAACTMTHLPCRCLPPMCAAHCEAIIAVVEACSDDELDANEWRCAAHVLCGAAAAAACAPRAALTDVRLQAALARCLQRMPQVRWRGSGMHPPSACLACNHVWPLERAVPAKLAPMLPTHSAAQCLSNRDRHVAHAHSALHLQPVATHTHTAQHVVLQCHSEFGLFGKLYPTHLDALLLVEGVVDMVVRGASARPGDVGLQLTMITARMMVEALLRAARDAAAGDAAASDGAAMRERKAALAKAAAAVEQAFDALRSTDASAQHDAWLPPARGLAAALLAWWRRPEAQPAAALEVAQAAAARSCAYLRCANLRGEGGPAAGEGAGSMRCRWVDDGMGDGKRWHGSQQQSAEASRFCATA